MRHIVCTKVWLARRESLIEAYRRGYNDRSQERDFDPGHALDQLDDICDEIEDE